MAGRPPERDPARARRIEWPTYEPQGQLWRRRGVRTVRVALDVVIEDPLRHADIDPFKRNVGEDEMEDEQRHVADRASHALARCSHGTQGASAQ